LRAGPALRPWQRVLLLLTGAALLAPLLVATQLTPSSRGMGTHQQLGLPACSLVQLVGVRCPACGMTTSWAWMVRGQVLKAVQANSGGAMLAVVTAVFAPWLLGSGARGRWLLGPPRETVALAIAVAVMAVTFIDWIVRIRGGM
jgi:hypothetical protein